MGGLGCYYLACIQKRWWHAFAQLDVREDGKLHFSESPLFCKSWQPWRNFLCSLNLVLFAGSSFIGGVKLVAAPSRNLCVATPGPSTFHNVGWGRPLTPDANACVTMANPRLGAERVCVRGIHQKEEKGSSLVDTGAMGKRFLKSFMF